MGWHCGFMSYAKGGEPSASVLSIELKVLIVD